MLLFLKDMNTIRLQLFIVLLFSILASSFFPEKPNMLWISNEANGPQMSCYGDTYATTLNIDQLAAREMFSTLRVLVRFQPPKTTPVAVKFTSPKRKRSAK